MLRLSWAGKILTLLQEGYLEASGQLVLNVAGILIIGLQEEVFFCQGDAQMISLALSFLSLLKTAGKWFRLLLVFMTIYKY